MAAHGHSHDHHGHSHTHGGGPGNEKALAWALALVTLVLLAELAGSLLSGSLALLSDAAHMFTDAAALAIALAALRLGKRGADRKRSFGYQRFEVLAALVNALMLLGAAAFIVFEAVHRFFAPAQIESGTMLWVAVLGLAVNLVGMGLLAGRSQQNLNLKGAYLEMWSDTLGSIGVIAGALVIRWTGWVWVDSAVALGIGLWVLPRTLSLLRDSAHVLLEGTPRHIDAHEVEAALLAQSGVRGVHDLHVWTIGSGEVCLTVHVVVPPDDVGDALLQRLRDMLAQRFGIRHSTVQLEQTPCEQATGHGFEPHGADAN